MRSFLCLLALAFAAAIHAADFTGVSLVHTPSTGKLTLHWAAAANGATLVTGDILTLTRTEADAELFDQSEITAAFQFTGPTVIGYPLTVKIDSNIITLALNRSTVATALPTGPASIVFALPVRQAGCGKTSTYSVAGLGGNTFAGTTAQAITAPACPVFVAPAMTFADYTFTISWTAIEAATFINGQVFVLGDAAQPLIGFAQATTTVEGWTASVEKYDADNRFAVLLYPYQADTSYSAPLGAGSVTISISPAAGQCGTSVPIALTGENSVLKSAVAPVTATVGTCATFTGFTSTYVPNNGTLGLQWTAAVGVENLVDGPIFSLTRDPDTWDLFDDMALTAAFVPEIPGYTLSATIDDASLVVTLHKEPTENSDLLEAFPPGAGSVVVTYVRARQLACGKKATYTASGVHYVQLLAAEGESNSVLLSAPLCPKFYGIRANWNSANNLIYMSWDGVTGSQITNGHIFTFARDIGSPIVYKVTGANTTVPGFTVTVTESTTSAGGYNINLHPTTDQFKPYTDDWGEIKLDGTIPADKCSLVEKFTFYGAGATIVPYADKDFLVSIQAPACKIVLQHATAGYGSDEGVLAINWGSVSGVAGIKQGPILTLTRKAGDPDLFDASTPTATLTFTDGAVFGYGLAVTVTSAKIDISLTVADGAAPFPATGASISIAMPTRQTLCGSEAEYTLSGSGLSVEAATPTFALKAAACPIFNGLTSAFDAATSTIQLSWTGVATTAAVRGHVITLEKQSTSAFVVDLAKPIAATTTAAGFTASAMKGTIEGNINILLRPIDASNYQFPTKSNSVTLTLPFIEARCEEDETFMPIGDGSKLEPAAALVTVTAPQCDPVAFTGFKAAYANSKLTLSWDASTGTVDLYNGTLITVTRPAEAYEMFEVETAPAAFVFADGITAEGFTLSASISAGVVSVTLAIAAEAAVFPSGAGSIVIDLPTRQMACDEHAIFTAAGFRNLVLTGRLTVDVIAPKCPYFTGVAGTYDAAKKELTIAWTGLRAAAIVSGHTMTLQHAVDQPVAFDSAVTIGATVSAPGWAAQATHFRDGSGAIGIALRKTASTSSDFPTTAGNIVLTLPYLLSQCSKTVHMTIAAQGSEFEDVFIDLATPACPAISLNSFTTAYDSSKLTLAWASASGADIVINGDFLSLTHKVGGEVLFDDFEPTASFVFPEGFSTRGYNLIAKLDSTALKITLAKTAEAGAFPMTGASIVLDMPTRQVSCGKATEYTVAGASNVRVVADKATTTLTAPACPSFKGVTMTYEPATSEIKVNWASLTSEAVVRGHLFSFVKATGSPTVFADVVAAGTISVTGYTATAIAAANEGEFFVMVRPAAGNTALFPTSAGSLSVKLDIPVSKCSLSTTYSLVGDGAAVDASPKATLDTPVCPKLSGFTMAYNPVNAELDLSWTAATGVAQLRTGPIISLAVVGAGKFFDSTASAASFVFPEGTTATGYTVSAHLENAVLTLSLTIAEGAVPFPATAGSIKFLAPSHQTACDTGNVVRATGESFIGLVGSVETTLNGLPCPRFRGIDVAFSQETSEFSFSWTSLPASATVRGTVFTLALAPKSPRMFSADSVTAKTDVTGYIATATLDETTGNIDIGLRAGSFMALGGETGALGNSTVRAVGEFPTGGGSITVSTKVSEAQCGEHSEFLLQDTGANFENAAHTKVSARGPCYSDSGLSGGEKAAIGVVIGLGVPLIIALIAFAMYKTQSGCFKSKAKHFDSSELVNHDYNTAHA
jgi:hypothetical protein